MNQNDLCLIINIGSLRLNDDKIVAIPIICLYFTLSGFDNLVRNNDCFSYQKGIIEDMGRPPTRPKKLKDGYYIEVRNTGATSGIKIRRDTEDEMMLAVKDYEKSKEVVILGESVNGKFVKDAKPVKKKS